MGRIRENGEGQRAWGGVERMGRGRENGRMIRNKENELG